jgi:class 3 adenylate cyclase/predicted ATPase/energy-coupling factor transporter ATP-binding protein EcfA2
VGLLVLEQRLSYQALKRLCDLDDAYLEDIKVELIDVRQLARDHAGRMLVWTGEGLAPPASAPLSRRAAFPLSTQDTPPPQGPQPPAVAHTVEAEHRQVTVLFCDLVDSTALAQQLGAEAYRTVILAYQEAAIAAAQLWAGYVAQYLGDGLMLYFGWPQAHEDAALRAVHASLAIIEAMEPLNTTHLVPQYGVHVAVRCGLHTGLAVIGQVGSGGRREQLALGDTPNIAARIQGLAAPNTVVLSATTAHLVQSTFALDDLGTHQLKGVAEPMAVFRVRGLSTVLDGDEATVPDRVPFLVGRDEEVGLLRRRWVQSTASQGQVVLLSGEAGIGKTALAQTLHTYVGHEGGTRITFRCSPYHTHSALYPVIDYLQRLLRLERNEPAEARLAKLEQALYPSRQPLAEVVPLLAALLAVPLPEERYPAMTLSPQQQRQQTQDVLVAWLFEAAEHQPVLAIYEDLHWADPSTLEWLGMVLEQAPTVPMLHMLTFRPDFAPPWLMRSHMTPMTLNRLEHPQVEALITHLAGGKALPAEVVEHIVAKTDGVPLFVEELTKTILESELLRADTDHYVLTGSLAAVPIPTTLQDSLMARLDRLPGSKELAQLGAVLGREFPYELLRALAPLDEATLQTRLAQLGAAELLYQRGRPPRARYIFKHALIQDTAYQSLLTSRRQQVHQQVAELLVEQFPETVETQPELVAQHYTGAGCTEQAIAYWQRAGQQALQRSADIEAIQHLTKGLELLATLPETPTRAQQELDLQLALGPALMATKGMGTPEVEQTYARARALCQQVGETPQLFPTLLGLWRFYHNRGVLQTARELGEQLLRLAQHTAAPTHLLEAHCALGQTLFILGEYTTARMHLEQGIAYIDPMGQRALALHEGVALGVPCLSYAALTLWCLGFPTQALRRSQEALTLAQELTHPYSLVVAQHNVAWLSQRRREARVVQAQADALLPLATAQGFPQWAGFGTFWQGWALAMQGQGDVSLAQMHQGMAALLATGQTVAWPYCLVLLAEAAGHVGQVEEGLRLLAEALAAIQEREQSDLLVETYRLQGELLLRQATPDTPQAEACFQQALTIARQQQAKSWELRAAMSLCRLWQCQGQRAEAYELLAPIYGWFTEGFDTADLKEAKALLDALGP